MSAWQRFARLFRRTPTELFNLVVEPAYAIKASRGNPYFKALERLARDAGFLGAFVVDAEGGIRPGRNEALPTRQARLSLDVYPNPAAIEGRSVSDYEDPGPSRRVPRATLALDDDSELFLWFDGKQARVAGAALACGVEAGKQPTG